MYTLKVTWTGATLNAVERALSRYLRGPAGARLRLAVNYLRSWREPATHPEHDDYEITLKPDWSDPVLAAVCTALSTVLRDLGHDALAARDNLGDRSYDDIVRDQSLVHAALRDIIGYLVNVEDLHGRTTEVILGGDPPPVAVQMIENKRVDNRRFDARDGAL